MNHQRYTLNFVNSAVENYRKKTPSFHKVINILTNYGGYHKDINNDHIAFRSFNRNNGFGKIKTILSAGKAYKPMDKYKFDSKYIQAQWFKPLISGYPRVFVSEIMDNQLSNDAQKIIEKYISHEENKEIIFNEFLLQDLIEQPNLKKVDYKDYQILNKESNYAAWTLVHGTIVNHETIPVHHLKVCNNLKSCLHLLSSNGIELMKEPELIKVSNDKLLLQASSVSDSVPIDFLDGVVRKIPGSFVEYIERKIIPYYRRRNISINDTHRREGFELGNAFFIFDSTKKMSQKFH
jgi:hypothetical protein